MLLENMDTVEGPSQFLHLFIGLRRYKQDSNLPCYQLDDVKNPEFTANIGARSIVYF